MEFVDVVMKRRAVRRFEEGGVDREVIERIARLAQRRRRPGSARASGWSSSPSRSAAARSPGSAARSTTSTDFGPWISECAAQFVPCVSARRSTTAATRSPTRSTTTAPRSSGRSRTGGSTSARRCRTSWLAAVERGARLRVRRARTTSTALRGVPRHPRRVHADRGDAGRAAAAGRAVTQPQARLGAVRGVRPLGALGLTSRPDRAPGSTHLWRPTVGRADRLQALAPDLRAAEEPVRRRTAGGSGGQRRRIGPPGVQRRRPARRRSRRTRSSAGTASRPRGRSARASASRTRRRCSPRRSGRSRRRR